MNLGAEKYCSSFFLFTLPLKGRKGAVGYISQKVSLNPLSSPRNRRENDIWTKIYESKNPSNIFSKSFLKT